MTQSDVFFSGTGAGDDDAPVLAAPLAQAAVLAPLVMVAEDHHDNRLIATTMLRHAGFRVIEAARGDEVVHLARAHQPAVILMDIGMPGMDGWTATEQLKADPATAKIIVLIVTAHAFSGDREMATQVGSDGYLTKPVSPTRLVRAVEHALTIAAR